MPIFVYKCVKGHLTEELVPINSNQLVIKCKCGRRAKKQLTTFRSPNTITGRIQ